jgi:VanZ family protein
MPRFPVLLRLLFWSALVFAFVMAVLPHPPRLPGAPSDKIQHILAFSVLSTLAPLAYPRARLLGIALGLSAFGVLIEVVQAFPALHRDASVLDWLADSAAIAVVLGLVALIRLRSGQQPRRSPGKEQS